MTIATTTDRTLFRQSVIAWLALATGIPASRVIWADQAEPRPDKPYASVLFSSGMERYGFDEGRMSFNAGTNLIERTTTGPRGIAAQVEIYSDPATTPHAREANDMLDDALLALETEAVRGIFRDAKIGVMGHTNPLRLDEQFGNRWERRSMAEVTFMYSGETFDDGGNGSGNWIENAPAPSESSGTATYGQ